MTTPPIKRRRTAQQILLRRACQTKGVNKSQDAAEIFGKDRNSLKGGVAMLPTVGRDLGRTQERSPLRPVIKMRRVSGERKTAGKLTVCDSLKDSVSCKKLKPNEGKRCTSGQRSGYTSRGSTKSHNSCAYPSKWPKNLSQEEDVNVISKGSLEELTKCSPLNRTPYDHNLNTPLKSGDSSQCPPIKKKARRRTLKSAAVSGPQMQAKLQSSKTQDKRGSSQSCVSWNASRVYSGEEVRHVKYPSKSNSEVSTNFSKCKLNSGVTFKNYGGYSASETELDTSPEMDRHFRCSNSFYKKIDKVSRPPSIYVNNGMWSLEIPSETEMQEFLSREHVDQCTNTTLSGECERKSRHERGGCKYCNRNASYCQCNSMANRKGCAMEATASGCGSFKRSQEDECMSSSRNSVKFRCRDWNENDYSGHELPRKESYPLKRPCDECVYIQKQSNECVSGSGAGGTRREPTNIPHQTRLSRLAYTVGACWDSPGAKNCGRGPSEIEYECKPSEASANRNCTEAITQTSKIIMTKRIDESACNCAPNCSSFEEYRSCPLSSSHHETINSSLNQTIKDEFVETDVNAQLKTGNINDTRSLKQEQCNSEQKSKHSAVPVVRSNSLTLQTDQNQINVVCPNSGQLVDLSCSNRPGKQEQPSCPACQQKLPFPSPPCTQALHSFFPSSSQGTHSSFNEQNSNQSNSHQHQNSQQSNSYNEQSSHQSNSNHHNSSQQSNSFNQQNCHQSNSNHQHNCHPCNAQQQHYSHQCSSVTGSLCQCNEQVKLSKRKNRRKNRRASRCRSRSSSARRKEVNCCMGGSSNERRTVSYEDCYNNKCDQMEDQCDVTKILDILHNTVAGLEEEMKKANRFEPRSKNRAQCEQQNTYVSNESCSSAPCQHELCPLSPTSQLESSCSSAPCQHELSPLTRSNSPCQHEPSPPCQKELPPLCPPCQQELPPPPLSTLCQQELSTSSPPFQRRSSLIPPCQQELCTSTRPPCQQEMCTSMRPPCPQELCTSTCPPCQQELCTSACPPCQQEVPPSNSPCHLKVPCKYGLSHSRPFCQPGSSSLNQPYQSGYASSYKPRKCLHHGCHFANAYSPPNNISLGRAFQTSNPFKYYHERKALPLACNWNQANQRYLKTAYENNQDLGMARGCTGTEQNYQSNMNRRKTQMYQPTYPTACKNRNRSMSDPEGHGLNPFKNWFRNTQRTCISPGNFLVRNVITNPRYGKCSLDATQLGNQEAINRGRVTFQKHVSCKSPRTQCYQANSNYPYGNCFGEMSEPSAHYEKSCQATQNIDNLRQDVCYRNAETLCTKSLAPAECHQASPQTHELNKSCAVPVQGIMKEIELEDCGNSTSSDRCLQNVQEINLGVCENKSSRDKFDSEICENPNCPYRYHRHNREIDVQDCENPNCPYRFKRNRIGIDLEACENPNCPYRYPRNREDIDKEVCDNPKCPYRCSRSRDDTDSKVCGNPKCPIYMDIDSEACGNPNCPYKFSRNREDIGSEACANPNCPYRFQKNRESIDSEICENPSTLYRFKSLEVCENPSCPFRFTKNIKDCNSVCENPNCPYRIQRNRTEIDSEVYEYPNTSDRLKRSPNIKILSNNPTCPRILKRAHAIQYQISDSTLSENSQELCEVSSTDSCADPHGPCDKNNMWLSGGFESFESNSIPSQPHYVKYKSEENEFKEVATDSCHGEFSRRRRVVFTDVTKKTNCQDSGKSDRHDDDSIKTKLFRKKWGLRHVPFDKIPINIASGVQPLSCNRNRHNPYLTEDLVLSSHDKHKQKHKIEKYNDGEPIKVSPPDCRSKNQTRPKNYNCNRNCAIVPSNGQPQLYDCDECCSATSAFSDCSCSKPQKNTNCKDNPKCSPSKSSVFPCGKHRERPRSQQEQPSDICSQKYIYISENESPRNYERHTSKSSFFGCCRKEKKPPSKTAENYCKTSTKWKKERRKNCEKSTSKSSLISCFKKEEKPSPQKREKNISENKGRKNVKRNTSKFSLISCLKKEEPAPPTRCQENYQTTGRRKSIQKDDFQCELKSTALPCYKKKEKSAPFQSENYGKRRRIDDESENDSEIEKIKLKSSGLPCSKKKSKIHPSKSHAKKEKHIYFEKENDSQIKENKSKSSGILCYKKKGKHPSDQSVNFAKKECRNFEKKNWLHCQKTKSKSSELICCKKYEKSTFQIENYRKKGSRNVEQENYSQSDKTESKSSGFLCLKKKEKSASLQRANNCKKGRRNAENYLPSEKSKSKSSGLLCFKKKDKPEENNCKKERRKYAEHETEIAKECEKKPSWLKVFPRCQREPRNKDEGDDVSEHQERTKKLSKKLTECFSSSRKSKNRKEPCNRSEDCEESRKKQPTCPYDNKEVRVLYDSSFRFNQESCSCFDIAENTYCYKPQEGSSTSCRLEKKNRQHECGNGFYQIGQ